MKLRPLAAREVPALHALEKATNAFPWSRQQFVEAFTAHHFGWGAERDGELRAFALFSLVLDEASLLNILVHPEAQRQGLATALLQKALPELFQRGARRCFLEVRVGNEAAIALYQRFGFGVDGRRRDYYPAAGGREDALLMSRDLPYRTMESV